MELRQLWYFTCVAQMKNISRAATRLNVAQPALSRQIRKLEGELGVSLLKREARGVELTEEGRALLEQATDLLDRARQLVENFNVKGRALEASLTIALPDWIGRLLIAPVLEKFKERYPRGALHVKVGLSGSIKEWLLNGGADLGLIPNADFLDQGQLELQLLFREPLQLVGPKAPHKAASKEVYQKKAVGLTDVAALPLILPGPEHGLRRLVDSAARARDVSLKAILEVDNYAILRNLVVEGRGYTLFAASGVVEDVKQGLMRAWDVDAPGCEVGLWMARPKAKVQSRPMQTVIRMLMQELHERGYSTPA